MYVVPMEKVEGRIRERMGETPGIKSKLVWFPILGGMKLERSGQQPKERWSADPT